MWMEPWVESGFFSGCVLLAEGDEVLYERCFGEANLELGVPNSPETCFAIASVTKPMQNILLARMVDAGALALTDTLSIWIEDFPSGDEIILADLANHTAGIPHRVTEPDGEAIPRSAADMVELVKQKGLFAPPGGDRVYSSAGYSVMARVLELAGGASWGELMQREVFDPAGMTHTVHPAEQRLIPGRASSYRWTPDGYRNTDLKDLSFLVGAGSLYSTPRDLLRCIRTLVDGGYGESAQLYTLRDGGVSWNGVTAGYRTFADHDSSTGRSVIVCANLVTGALDHIREGLPRLMAGEPLAEPELPRIPEFMAEGVDLSPYTGDYQMRPGRTMHIVPSGDHLLVDSWMLFPLGGDRFFSPQDFARVEFQRDADGAVTGLVWGKDRVEMPRVSDGG
jgi:CubicO group peptidase (beta-lactamase class C family)